MHLKLFTYIKIHVDQNHHAGDFWLTGSQVFKLMERIQESLAGRACLLHMAPVSQAEIYGAASVPFMNYKTISDAAGIDQVTAKNWIGILERLGIVFYLHPYSNNMLKRMLTKPKLYFYYCGLVAYLTKWSDRYTLMNGTMNGAILENFVVSEIVKSYQNCGREAFVYYYRKGCQIKS